MAQAQTEIVTTVANPLENYEVSPVFEANSRSTKRVTVNQGGTRSGKTYSILQVLILCWALKRRGLIIDIVRKTLAELQDTVYTDFIEILTDMGLYRRKAHNMTKRTYRLNGNLFRFIGLDKAQKKRGSKRNVLYINEANGLTLEDWVQLNMRTSEKVYIDYNPSEFFWCNEHILEGDPTVFDLIRSTYLDNYDFLPQSQIDQIEALITIDEFYYRVYVLGEFAIMKGKIWNNITRIQLPEYEDLFHDEIIYGLDFGFVHYTCLVEIKISNEESWERCLYMTANKTDDALLALMDELQISYTADIYADPANASAIRRLRDAGYVVHKAIKDVKDSIRFCQGAKRNIVDDGTVASKEYIRQNNLYKYKSTADGKVIEEPVKIDDDGPDAWRYGWFNHMRKKLKPLK